VLNLGRVLIFFRD